MKLVYHLSDTFLKKYPKNNRFKKIREVHKFRSFIKTFTSQTQIDHQHKWHLGVRTSCTKCLKQESQEQRCRNTWRRWARIMPKTGYRFLPKQRAQRSRYPMRDHLRLKMYLFDLFRIYKQVRYVHICMALFNPFKIPPKWNRSILQPILPTSSSAKRGPHKSR